MDLPESVSNIETYKEVDYMVLRGTCTINVPLDRYTYDWNTRRGFICMYVYSIFCKKRAHIQIIKVVAFPPKSDFNLCCNHNHQFEFCHTEVHFEPASNNAAVTDPG